MMFDLSPFGLGINLEMIVWLSHHVGHMNTARSKLENDEYMTGTGWNLTFHGYKPMLTIDDDNLALLFKLTWL
jgi:hypothetical protein